MSMVTFSVFHTQEWLVKYSSTIMALWRRVMVLIILQEHQAGRRGGELWYKDSCQGMPYWVPRQHRLYAAHQADIKGILHPTRESIQYFVSELIF